MSGCGMFFSNFSILRNNTSRTVPTEYHKYFAALLEKETKLNATLILSNAKCSAEVKIRSDCL